MLIRGRCKDGKNEDENRWSIGGVEMVDSPPPLVALLTGMKAEVGVTVACKG